MLTENLSVPPDRRVWAEASALREAGHIVSIICPAGPGQPLRETLEGVRMYRYPAPRSGAGVTGYVREYAVSLWHALRLSVVAAAEVGFDVIHAGNPPDLFFFIAAVYRPFGVRYVFDQHDLSPELYESRFGSKGLPHRVLKAMERGSYARAHAVIVPNESYGGIAIGRGRCAPDRVFVVRNGPRAGWPPVLRPDPSLKRGKRYLALFMGVMGPQDGVEDLLRAAAEYRALGQADVHFALVGSGDAVPDLRRIAVRLGVEEDVEFVGWLSREEDLGAYLATADVCLSPEPSSPLNDVSTFVKVMEYMAAEKPIVAFDLLETRRTAGAAAVYCRSGDSAAFAQALARVLSDRELRAAMIATSRERMPGLRWEAQTASLRAAYSRLGGRTAVDEIAVQELD